MAENAENQVRSPLRRNRPSPRKHPYERNILGGGGSSTAAAGGAKIIETTTSASSTIVRSPLKNIQAALGLQQPKQPLQKPGGGGGGVKKPSPTKIPTKGKQILEYLQLGQGQQKRPALLPDFHQQPQQPRPQSALIHAHQPIKIYTEDNEENGTEDKKPKDLVGVVVEKKLQPADILQPLLQPPSPSDSLDKSTTGGGSGSGGSSLLNISSASSSSFSMMDEMESDNATTSPFKPKEKEVVKKDAEDEDEEILFSKSGSGGGGGNVTQGVLGTLQPRGLNSSFTEKFESRLGINSGPIIKSETATGDNHGAINDENVAPGGALATRPGPSSFGGSGSGRGLLKERMDPLFLHCPEYISEILRYWAKLELKFKINWDYMERHSEISHKMRTILVDWLVEVGCEYDLTEETLHLTVNYVDRFLSKMKVQRNKLQLVGAAALFIAAKFEETNPPEIAEFIFITDDAYTKKEILALEHLMLSCLEFDLMMPTAHSLAMAYCSLVEITDPTRSLVMYLVDLSLMEGQIFLRFLPTVLAGAAVALARFSFGGAFWDSGLQKYCGHRKSTVLPAVRALHTAFFDAPTKSQSCIFEKYGAVRYCSVAKAFIPHNGPWD